ncbi:class I SAM-dependent methyltransferase [Flavobacterium cerinum]|uniref:Methyltransferase domain-containing protein n=1 Tax=Flavobacterium cerinum TaxID=2502784 RepID=A0A444H8M6_9FLAO|nr:methyltransferase domain-containing protein [Flavobacterium cerinum]RWW99566.1 methyltransferase domain-containing protein [Flavobacterium cerinum]
MIKSSHKFYNALSFLYPVIDVFIGAHKKRLISHANALPGLNLLEIGVGNGSCLKLYKDKVITAIDSSEGMLAEAKIKNGEGVQFIQMDGEKLDFSDAAFDIAVMCHVLAVTSNPDRMLTEAFRVLKPKGYLLILNHFTPDNFIGFIDRGFKPFARLLKFRSEFYFKDLDTSNYTIVNNLKCGKLGYFKLIILQKP